MFSENDNQYKSAFQNTESSFSPRRRKSRFFFWFLVALIILGIAFLSSVAVAYKFYSTSKKVIEVRPPESFLGSLKDIASGERKVLRGEREGRINILLLGLAGENYPGENLTDSIIIASVNPKTYQTAMLSIPRDLYVQIPDTSSYTKINALYARGKDRHGRSTEGIEDLKNALTDITGLSIHYYIALDFDGFKKVIDELNGVKIQVPKDIHDERYPGPNFSYETFDIEKGLYTFDGEVALKYTRTRHDEDGDFGRAYRQQLILESARSKAFSIETLVNLPAINNILNILGNHLRTDIPLDELESFLELSKKIDTHLTVNEVLDAGRPDSLMAVSHVFFERMRAFILIPRTGKYDEIQELARNIFDLELLERKKKSVEEENAKVAIINKSGSPNFDRKLSNLLQKLGYQTKIAASSANKINLENQTAVYDISKTKPFSAENISEKLGAAISQNLPGNLATQCQNADLCLVARADLVDNLNYEENSVADLEQGYDKQTVDERTYIDLLKRGSSQKF